MTGAHYDKDFVDAKSTCRVTNGKHVPTTWEKRNEEGQHIKLNACKSCGSYLR